MVTWVCNTLTTLHADQLDDLHLVIDIGKYIQEGESDGLLVGLRLSEALHDFEGSECHSPELSAFGLKISNILGTSLAPQVTKWSWISRVLIIPGVPASNGQVEVGLLWLAEGSSAFGTVEVRLVDEQDGNETGSTTPIDVSTSPENGYFQSNHLNVLLPPSNLYAYGYQYQEEVRVDLGPWTCSDPFGLETNDQGQLSIYIDTSGSDQELQTTCPQE